jgi:hypothetical protein
MYVGCIFALSLIFVKVQRRIFGGEAVGRRREVETRSLCVFSVDGTN